MTNSETCQLVVQRYLSAVGSAVETNPIPGGCLIVTPFERPDGGFIELAMQERPDGGYRLSDMGDSMSYLHVNGLTLTRATVEEAQRIARRFGVALERNTLLTDLPQEAGESLAMHDLLQAVLAVTALIQKRRPYLRLRFEDEVESLIIAQGQTYDSDFVVAGAKQTHIVKFHINSQRKLLVQPLSPASEHVAYSWAERWAFRFRDIADREAEWNRVAVLDDRGDRVAAWSHRARTPLEGLARLVAWSSKEDLVKVLRS